MSEFDFSKAAGFALMRGYNPGSVPPGAAVNFLSPADYDASRSLFTLYDAARTCVYASRSQSSTLLSETFDSLSAWSSIHTALAAVSIAPGNDPDPEIGNVMDMQTGATLSAVAGAQKPLAPIPASFGVMIQVKLNAVGPNPLDALNMTVQASNGATLRLRFNDNSVTAFVGNAWQQLSSHGGNYFTEWWIEANQQADGTYIVSLYAGTQKLASVAGALSPGTAGQNNLVTISQQSGATPNRHSQASLCNIGVTQLPDHMVMCSQPITVPTSPTTANIAILVEDVSVDLVSGINFFASVTKDNTATWTAVPLTDYGVFGPGEVDNQKNMRWLAGSVDFAPGNGTGIRYCIESDKGGFYVVQGVSMFWGTGDAE